MLRYVLSLRAERAPVVVEPAVALTSGAELSLTGDLRCEAGGQARGKQVEACVNVSASTVRSCDNLPGGKNDRHEREGLFVDAALGWLC